MVYVITETYWDGERMNPEIKCVCKNRKSMEVYNRILIRKKVLTQTFGKSEAVFVFYFPDG